MVDDIIVTEERVVEVEQNALNENIHCDGDQVAVFGDYSEDGKAASVEAFEAALDAYENSDVDGARAGGLLVEDGSFDEELYIRYSKPEDGIGVWSGTRATRVENMRDLLDAAAERIDE